MRNATECTDLGGKPKPIAPPPQGALDRWKKTEASRAAWKAGKGKPGGGSQTGSGYEQLGSVLA